jgi:hypothetical protein
MNKHRNRFGGRRLHLFSLIAIIVVVGLIAGVVNIVFKQNPSKSAFAGNYSAQEVIQAVNEERAKQNLPTLKVDQKLMEASKNKVDDMIANNYFAHISPIDGKKWSTFIRGSGYDYVEAGENLANGFDNVPDLVTAWMNSPTHRDNILNPDVDETGLAVKSGFLDGYPTIFVAQAFGKRDVVVSKPEKSDGQPGNSNSPPANQPAKNVDQNTTAPNTVVKKNPQQTENTQVKKEIKIDKSKKVGELIKLENELNLSTENIF